MKFIKENIHDIVRLLLNQIALAVFGLVLVSAARMAQGTVSVLVLVASIVSILFYMYILYATMQEIGSKHRIRVEGGRMKRDSFWGLKTMTLAQVPTFVVLFLLFVGYLFMIPFGESYGCRVFGTNLYAIAQFVIEFAQSMFMGVIDFILYKINIIDVVDAKRVFANIPVGAIVYVITFLISVIPGQLVCWGSYNMGLRDMKLVSLFTRKTPNKPEE